MANIRGVSAADLMYQAGTPHITNLIFHKIFCEFSFFIRCHRFSWIAQSPASVQFGYEQARPDEAEGY